ncbi:hypothetical protein ZIOFF_001220 [Zingiber officinale]|uniref:Auxin-responsive protein n=2 Tax=Zingiber officinale TaxID=94328 RepID=A0A8J5HUK3_ZINOF|nr:hypothetical protein ZIOFF_001220 [Zingiber officinale]
MQRHLFDRWADDEQKVWTSQQHLWNDESTATHRHNNLPSPPREISNMARGSVRPKNICCLLNRQPQLPHRALTEKHPDASSADGEDDPLHFSVHKQGVALGRSVDLTKFDGYDQLIEELDQLFEFKGELMAPNKNWMIVFTDNEDDMMLVGDDPWQEFCAMVRQIFIYTKEEVQKMDSSTLNPKNEDCPDMKENVKETKGSQSASSSNSKNS